MNKLWLVHELAFLGGAAMWSALRAQLGPELELELATNSELPVADAVQAYPFIRS